METKEPDHAKAQNQNSEKEHQPGRFKLPVHWSDSEFFRTWLKLAREGQKGKSN